MKKRRRKQRKEGLRRINKYRYSLSDTERLDVHFITISGKVESFGVCYEHLFEEEWIPLKWCDNSHDTKEPHCHVFGFKGGKIKEDRGLRTLLPDEDPNLLLTQVIEDLKRNRGIILSSFRTAYERERKNSK